MSKLEKGERELLESFEAGERETVDLEALQKRALREGIPYQTLVAGILHKYVAGHLIERNS